MVTDEKLAEIIKRHKQTEGALIPILHEVQDLFGYIPHSAQETIADELKITIADIYGVITFYSRFTLKPTGKYKACICLGTACYVKGAEGVLNFVKEHLGINPGETTSDGLFSVEETRCLGACGLAPIMKMNGDVYARVTPEQVGDILLKYRAQG